MTLKGQTITAKDAQNCFFSSFEGKYNIMDNLDEKGDPIIYARPEIYNSEYVYVTVVLKGTLHLVIGGTPIDIKENEYLAVMPCMSVEVKESRCIFYSYLVQNYIMAEIYKRGDLDKMIHSHAFQFRHARCSKEENDVLLNCYLRIKEEHLRDDYPMKEMALRAYYGAYIVKGFSYLPVEEFINHVKNNRQYKFFDEFILMLNQKHKEERAVQYYANAMHITPKYLSAIVKTFTQLTASQVIDQYVIFAIKQSLYSNKHNIKTISAEYHFPSQSFFGRYFKRLTGMSPNVYIKHHNIKSINFNQPNSQEEQ